MNCIVHETAAWQKLADHASNIISNTHLRNLLADGDRCAQLVASHNGIVLDYSRQRVNADTMVNILTSINIYIAYSLQIFFNM